MTVGNSLVIFVFGYDITVFSPNIAASLPVSDDSGKWNMITATASLPGPEFYIFDC